ncbi:hypothetical protein [Streptococcus suis]|uniref:hypothetical protein n=1 Tax=Streptococcus suis TaxID=1307 RepID=UPI0005CEDE5D|nr:hypothetical protein [Streptococcus suis]NQO18569.1 hypothetical protein [Streptococcus suis]NQO22681.1 hypothetical protein [Streptococcus suis]CYV07833.1 Uncharacterised protein [Streptococcus suis]
MEWIDLVFFTPANKSDIIAKLDNDGYTYPRYNLKYKKVVPVIDVLAIQRDCERVGIALADVYPRQIALF